MTTSMNDLALDSGSYAVVDNAVAQYCARSTCNTLIHAGMPVKKYDAATVTHIVCPDTNFRNFAAHKQPDSGMRFGRDSV